MTFLKQVDSPYKKPTWKNTGCQDNVPHPVGSTNFSIKVTRYIAWNAWKKKKNLLSDQIDSSGDCKKLIVPNRNPWCDNRLDQTQDNGQRAEF